MIRTVLSGACLALLVVGGTAYAGSLSSADKSFMIAAAKIDMTEAHKGQLAESQANRADVKDFAKVLVRDHTESYEQLSEFAAKTGVSIPRGITASRTPAIVQLVHLKGGRFDRRFAGEEVAADRQAIAVFKREAAHGHDAGLKDYAAKTVTVLENDLKLAEGCARPVKHS